MYGFLFDNYSINEKWVAMHIASYCCVCTHPCSFQCKYEQEVITLWNLIADFHPLGQSEQFIIAVFCDPDIIYLFNQYTTFFLKFITLVLRTKNLMEISFYMDHCIKKVDKCLHLRQYIYAYI